MELAVSNGRTLLLKMSGFRCFLLVAWFLQLYFVSPGTCCGVFENPYGNVTDDQEIEVGSTLKFQCTLFNKTIQDHGLTPQKLILKFKDKILTNTRVVDDYTIEYSVEHSAVNDSGMYHCYVPIDEYFSPQLVCSSYIAVGHKPLDVTQFSCISMEYTNLTCSWKPPLNHVYTEYMLYDFLYIEMYRRKCPVPRPSSCGFRLDTKPAYMQNQEYLNFVLVGNNSLGTSQQHFKIKHSEIIKPGIPGEISFSHVSETSMSINLNTPKGFENGEFPDGLIYSIKFYSISTKLDIVKVVDTQSKSNAHLKIDDLVPHTQYKFEVKCRLNVSDENFYWSETKNVTEVTRPDVPYRTAEIDSSSFDVQVIAGNRTIALYWKAVPSQFENGDDFHYIVRYHEHHVPSRGRRAVGRSNTEVRVDNGTTHSFKHMDLGTAYIFNIIAANAVGNSSNETAIIVVDKSEKLLPGPKDITVISYGQGNYETSWMHPSSDLSNFTLYWCATLNSRPAKCDGALDWTSVVNRTHHKLFLPNHFNYQFAVATVHEHRTSGMHWAPCIVTYGVPYSIHTLQLSPRNSTSLKVRWSLKCEAEKKIIKEYAIHYCPYEGNCSSENSRQCKVHGASMHTCSNVSITNTSSTEQLLTALKPHTCYCAYLRVRTDGGWGENSEIASEITLSSAPDDPPTNVRVVAASQSPTVKVTFDPPTIPNGLITRYLIYYNRSSSDQKVMTVYNAEKPAILEKLHYYTNYSIQVQAWVGIARSEMSKPVYVFTSIANPGIIEVPRPELMDDFVNITWKPPQFPNGPITFYQVRMENNESNIDDLFNVTDKNFYKLNRDCATENRVNAIYEIRVRAVNFRGSEPLYGEFSGPAKTMLCPKGYLSAFKIGIIVGCAIFGMCAVLVLYYCVRYLQTNIAEAKKIEIKLPKGLNSPLDNNPLSSYDKFKSGLQNSRDAGIPNDRVYDRYYTTASDGNFKGTEVGTRGHGGRNPSGESDISGKGHDSISSANTTKTHNSMDSGAEVESPPSPDSFSSDSMSMTPRSFKPDLVRVNEVSSYGSRDSGLAKDDSRPINFHMNLALSSRGRCFEHKYRNGLVDAYSKFAIKGSCYIPQFVALPGQNITLSNSEPSVADAGDGSEPLVNAGIQPYSKYGIARSAGNGLNAIPSRTAYSKFGALYRPLKMSPDVQPQVFSAFIVPGSSSADMLRQKEELKKPLNLPVGNAYSKFGTVESGTHPNTYISLLDALKKPHIERNPSHRTDAIPDGSAISSDTTPHREDVASDIVPDIANVSGKTLPQAAPDSFVPDVRSVPQFSDNVPQSPTSCFPPASRDEVSATPMASSVVDLIGNMDISDLLPESFVLGCLENDIDDYEVGGADVDNSKCGEELANELNLPRDSGFSNKFLSGGQVFLNNNDLKDNAAEPNEHSADMSDFWNELDPIVVDPDAYGNDSDSSSLPEHTLSNGYPLLTEDLPMSARVISRQNLATVPVEIV